MSFSPPGLGFSVVGFVSACAFLVLSTISLVHAAHDHEKGEPEAVDPESAEPRLSVPEYRSPLSAYQPFEDADPQDWKEANDRVGEIGGWRVYSREPFEEDNENDMEEDSK